MDQNALIEWVLPCKRLAESLDFYTGNLGFRIDAIFPADAPRVAHISGYGTKIRLEQSDEHAPRSLRLISDSSEKTEPLVSPDGTRIEQVYSVPELSLPPLRASCVIHINADESKSWGEGRAGMQYHDLVPDRQGGALIASHIRIPQGGPVPDYVHHHGVLFQLIYCLKGWVKVVYEDQGPEFVLQEGDCVLQPPGIRHRVLESSDGLEVVEVSSPAEHMTFVDHELTLPSPVFRPEREFGGQNFVHHQAANATWQTGEIEGFESRNTGLYEASAGIISLHVLRATNATAALEVQSAGELQFFFVLKGTLEIEANKQTNTLQADDAFLVPGGMGWHRVEASADLELLQLTIHNYDV